MALPSLCYTNHVLEPPDFRPQWICSCRISISNYVIILFCAKCYKVAWFSRWNSAHTSFFHRVSKITDTNCTSRFFFFPEEQLNHRSTSSLDITCTELSSQINFFGFLMISIVLTFLASLSVMTVFLVTCKQ